MDDDESGRVVDPRAIFLVRPHRFLFGENAAEEPGVACWPWVRLRSCGQKAEGSAARKEEKVGPEGCQCSGVNRFAGSCTSTADWGCYGVRTCGLRAWRHRAAEIMPVKTLHHSCTNVLSMF